VRASCGIAFAHAERSLTAVAQIEPPDCRFQRARLIAEAARRRCSSTMAAFCWVMRSISPTAVLSRFTEAQIIGMIKEQEAGLPTVEICRKHGLSTATFYKMKAKYGGLEVSDARRLRQLEDENGKLKRLLADSMLDNVILKDLLGKV
jgi:putative transposase